MTKLRILTLNLHKGFSALTGDYTLPILREALRHANVDLVFLQEVLGENHLKIPLEHSFNGASQYEFLADKVWADFAYGKNAIYPAGHHGNAILSRYPIEERVQHDISTYALEQRGILHCSIRIPRAETTSLTTHEDDLFIHALCIHLGLFGFHRRQQYKMIRDYIDENIPPDCPLIIAGDLNDWTNRADQLLKEELELIDVHEACTGRVAKTFPIFFPLLPLDRIYTRYLKPIAAETLKDSEWMKLSDHLALKAELKIL